MAQNVFKLVHTALDTSGVIEPNATVEFYDAGTSTPRTVYSDRALTTTAGASVTASATGVLPERWLPNGVLIKLVYKDADGAIRETRDYVNDNGANDDGITWAHEYGDLSSAFSTALAAAITAAGVGGYIKVQKGLYTMTAGVTLLAQQTLEFIGGPYVVDFATDTVSKVSRGFNGTAFTMTASGCGIRGLCWDGVGATYTGVCCYIAGGEQQWLELCNIDDNADACLQFVGADAGQRFVATDCHFRRTTATDPAVVMPTTVDTAGNRQFEHCSSFGGCLIQFNKSVNTHIHDGRFSALDFTGSTSTGADQRSLITGCRIAGEITIAGGGWVIQGNVHAGDITLGATVRRSSIGPVTNPGFNIIDNSGAPDTLANFIYSAPAAAVTPVWAGSSSAPTFSANSVVVQHEGADLILIGTHTFSGGGSGTYSLTLPSPYDTILAAETVYDFGGRFVDDNTGNTYAHQARITAGSGTIAFFNEAGAQMSDAAPVTVASGDTFSWRLRFRKDAA